jgi:hypothetical protein
VAVRGTKHLDLNTNCNCNDVTSKQRIVYCYDPASTHKL